MDNFRFDVTSEGRNDFATVLRLAFRGAPGGKAYSYAIHPTLGLVLRWKEAERDEWIRDTELRERKRAALLEQGKTADEAYRAAVLDSGAKILALPYALDAVGATDFAWGWLQQADYGEQPDIDGSCGEGWRVFNEAWGHVGGDHYAFVAIQPVWALYGK